MNAASRELRFLHGRHTARSLRGVRKRFDGYYAFQFMRRGKVAYAGPDRKPLVLQGCWTWCTYPGPEFSYFPMEGEVWDHRYIAFAGKLALSWDEAGLIGKEPQKIQPSEVAYYADAIDSILRWFEIPGRMTHLRATNSLENLFIDLYLLRSRSSISKNRRTLADIVGEELQRRQYGVIKAVELARRVGMSESTFRRKFLEETGVPVNRYLIQKRLQKARTLLIETRRSIQEIADQTGFSDVYYFHRMFSREFRITPRRFQLSVAP